MWSRKLVDRFFICYHLCKWDGFESLNSRWLPGLMTGGRGHVIRKLLAMSSTYVPSLKLIGLTVLPWQPHLRGRRKIIIIIIIINIAASSDDRVSRHLVSSCHYVASNGSQSYLIWRVIEQVLTEFTHIGIFEIKDQRSLGSCDILPKNLATIIIAVYQKLDI